VKKERRKGNCSAAGTDDWLVGLSAETKDYKWKELK
jgi:hypothetical protein